VCVYVYYVYSGNYIYKIYIQEIMYHL